MFECALTPFGATARSSQGPNAAGASARTPVPPSGQISPESKLQQCKCCGQPVMTVGIHRRGVQSEGGAVDGGSIT